MTAANVLLFPVRVAVWPVTVPFRLVRWTILERCRLYRSWFVRRALLGLAVYIAAAWFFQNHDLMIGLRILEIAGSAAVMYTYAEDLESALLAEQPNRFQIILMGIIGSFSAILISAALSYIWRLAGEPPWFINIDAAGLPIWIRIQAAILHVSAKGAFKPGYPRKQRIQMGGVVGVVVAVMLLILTRAPDVAPFLEKLRPALEAMF